MSFYKLINRGCIFSTLIFSLASCSFENFDDEFSYSEFAKIDSLEVKLPLEYIQITNWTTYSSEGKELLVEYGLNGNGDLVIHRIDFDKKTYLEPIHISREGPNGFNSSAASVCFKAKDSIYVFPTGRKLFYLYNSKGIKTNEYKYNSMNNSNFYKNGWYSSMAFFEKSLILTTVDNTRYDDPDFFDKVSPIQFYNLDSNTFTDQIVFPEFVKGKYTPSNLSGAMIDQVDKDCILINYSFSDSIYIYNIKDKLANSFFCGSDNFGSPRILDFLPDRSQSLNYTTKEVNYETGFYHQEKVYRIVSHLISKQFYEYSPFEIIQNNWRVVSLIELDLETNKLRYFKMPTAKYFVFQKNQLFAGGVSVREEAGDIYRKFYKYTFN